MKHVHILRVGIAPYEAIRERTLSIARGDYKPAPSEPKIWFSSMESLAQVLSTRNKLLLELIAQTKPQSMTELAQLSGRHKSNLSRTLKTMEHYGLVKLSRQKSGEIRPQVTFDHLRVDMPFSSEQRRVH
jgi:predicted transcriptional regulator